MSIGTIFLDRYALSANKSPATHRSGDIGFNAQLDLARSNSKESGKIDNPSFALPQSPANDILHVIKDSRDSSSAPAMPTPESGTKPQISFPPGFPTAMKERLTDFLNRSDLSTKDKEAMWATTVASLDLMNNGPAGFRSYLTNDTRFGSSDFDPLKLLETFGKALGENGYPAIPKAVQEYLQSIGKVS